MTSLDIRLRKGDDPVLHKGAYPVPPNTDVRSVITAMWHVLTTNRGIGLAAPQIGVTSRIIIVAVDGLKLALINPKITKRYGGKISSKEGCLSYPGKQVTMVRDKQVIVQGYDEDWQPVKRKLRGLAAYCVQHEVDHLNGITIADKPALKGKQVTSVWVDEAGELPDCR